jgi:Ca-activated chloride channel homolog
MIPKRSYRLSFALILGFVVAHPVPGQVRVETEPDEVIRIDANLVTIPAQVMDRNGRFITNLQREDFQIFEDGVEQEVSFFSPVEEPFTILFLMDVSGSMYVHLSELALAANAFLSQLRPDDKFIAVSFCDEVKTLAELGPVKETRVKPIKLGICGKGTFVYEAVHHALKRMKKISGRRAIVLFSDGLSDQKRATAKSTLREAEQQQALIYSVQFGDLPLRPGTDANSQRFNKTIENANDYMAGIAQKTGGRHYRVEDITDLKKTFGEVADELRRQYSLGYYPKIPLTQGLRRTIKVSVRRPGLAVRARDSYLAVPQARGKP